MKVILVDDDQIQHFLVNKMFTKFENVSSEFFFGVKEAIEYLTTVNSNVDLIFLDLNMPGLDGWDFLNEYSSLNISKKNVYILTSSINSEDEYKALQNENVLGFVTKPMTLSKLTEILEGK